MKQCKVINQASSVEYCEKMKKGITFPMTRNFFPCHLPTMPLTDEEYGKEMMFPVFDGLIPEGWLLDIVSFHSWRISP
ncbi:MAG: hypothetical protein NC308_02775 [Clostridium sp.]|nr:hypothetical protein [Bacteroides sp.]MCM1197788.1 hypothetical protein [Clostridium sp.]